MATSMISAQSEASEAVSNGDTERWQAVVTRDRESDGRFFYAVRSTGIYCRPSCPARRPRRPQVEFYATCEQAEHAGYRPCKRCQPRHRALSQRWSEIIDAACRTIERSPTLPSLGELAADSGLSPAYFHRLFRAATGVTPKAYGEGCRSQRLALALQAGASVTDAIYAAGFNSSARFYAGSKQRLGMTPRVMRAGAEGELIEFALGRCWLGRVLVATTAQGLCAVALGNSSEELTHDLRRRFPKARIQPGGPRLRQQVDAVVRSIGQPSLELALPLDLRGTAFQQQVWRALRHVLPGTTASYGQIARQIGRPAAARAVARACAANPLAVIIPCHRIVQSDGQAGGYRWGPERKRDLLAAEGANRRASPRYANDPGK
ncbi:MAG TPA: bifunctional DNA-binding transcriptional regulator/O6-methylguanine-DNA methyltransferase Ada [Candidatus Binataceae bacterium]|nr:bifunctional DNA-binding transcriptional regulator/O6-methylguanine-DNA methyltransferase Ada [Candidatus Binataceae bacterium]